MIQQTSNYRLKYNLFYSNRLEFYSINIFYSIYIPCVVHLPSARGSKTVCKSHLLRYNQVDVVEYVSKIHKRRRMGYDHFIIDYF